MVWLEIGHKKYEHYTSTSDHEIATNSSRWEPINQFMTFCGHYLASSDAFLRINRYKAANFHVPVIVLFLCMLLSINDANRPYIILYIRHFNQKIIPALQTGLKRSPLMAALDRREDKIWVLMRSHCTEYRDLNSVLRLSRELTVKAGQKLNGYNLWLPLAEL